ncbi:HlyD family secretion protein [Dyella flagellata]|uniref:Secretion protein n=1 Tax=Dyella flagellata TaxID=1867833 RepID=A0ABQ5XEZ7_9GAMM|nr:HlyD family efflux transporter periplasmic adaptor subunit [Dyella flagellata]GLQ89754.1 secretion protein [Dyella flagellata]
MNSIFRKEVIEAKRGQWLGTIRVASPLSHQVLTLCALAVGVALVVFLVTGQYTRRERTSGTLVPTAGLIEITATLPGTITRALVTQGATVHAGEPIALISSDRSSVTLGATAAAVSQQLKLQRLRLEEDLAAQDKLQAEQSTAIHDRLGMLRGQLDQLDGQVAILNRQAASAREMLEKMQSLREKGYISALQTQQQESSALDWEAQVKALRRQRLDTQQQIAAAEDQLRQLPLTVDTQKHDLERKRAEVDQSIAENELQREAVLRAPTDGTVSSLLVRAGQAVASGQVVLAVVPKGSLLEAQLLVPSRSIGFVRPGDAVVLRYQAYPYQKFGLHIGHVKAISHSAMTPQQITSLSGQQAAEAMYSVEVDLDRQTLLAYGQEEALMPGMALDADILLDRRRLVEWIFEPLYGMGRQWGLKG